MLFGKKATLVLDNRIIAGQKDDIASAKCVHETFIQNITPLE